MNTEKHKVLDLSGMGWEQCTSKGSEVAQLRVWSNLSVRKRLEALDEMSEHARRTIASRKARGLPYIDPYTGQLVATRSENSDPST